MPLDTELKLKNRAFVANFTYSFLKRSFAAISEGFF